MSFNIQPIVITNTRRTKTVSSSTTSLYAALENKRIRKRDRILRTINNQYQILKNKGNNDNKEIEQDMTKETNVQQQKQKTTELKVNIYTQEQLDDHWNDKNNIFTKANGEKDYNAILRSAQVKGDTQIIGSKDYLNYTHPVVQLLHERKQERLLTHGMATNSDMTSHCKVALAIEGGGMRGCVSAGAIAAIHYLNLTNTIDTIYGSSAGTIVGAYLITDQLPWFGPEVYYDQLTTAGSQFIDTKRLLRALGLGLLDPRLLRDVVTRPNHGKPVLNLHYLLKRTVQYTKPLNWNKFVKKQNIQPLNVVTSGLKSEKSIILNMANNGFNTLEELTDAMHASCLLPGIAGPVMNLDKRVLTNDHGKRKPNSPKMILGNNYNEEYLEPLADALLYEPLPYRTAIAEHNVTHCIVIRSRPDGVDVTGKGGFAEMLIAKRFFTRKNKLYKQYERMKQHLHKKIYAEDIIKLNKEAYSTRDPIDVSKPHIMTIAVPPGSDEVTRLETGREAIFYGFRRGFARAYDCLVADPKQRGNGIEIAKKCFPDEILDYNPNDFDDITHESAFAAYMKLHNISPKAWDEQEHLFE